MDFGKLFDTRGPANAGAWLTLTTPGGQPTPFKLKLAGEDSDIFRDVRHELANRRLRASNNATAQVLELNALYLLAKCTLAWEGFDSDCTFEAVRTLYEAYPEAARQADKFIGDRRNYQPQEEVASAAETQSVSA